MYNSVIIPYRFVCLENAVAVLRNVESFYMLRIMLIRIEMFI